ncbi:MAG: molybdopterin-dependent oxidoreductase [Clostridium sp.]|uniref:molybdopterin-containing oxidoreductase family protein n=1 Tax=Clostridium sp. TaxID=1506 RepID=UPI002FC8F140
MVIVKANCNICSGYCGIKAHIENNRVIKVEGDFDDPVTRGVICIKGKSIPDIINNSERLSSPLKNNGNGTFSEISWDEAIDIISGKLIENRDKWGGKSLVVHTGQAGVGKEFPQYYQRFTSAYGSPNYANAGSHCHTSKEIAHSLTLGYLPSASFRESKCLVFWGYNPQNSCPPSMLYIKEALNKGCKLIIVDPYETKLSKHASIHLKLRPGTDGALALGLINVIINEKLYDEDFVNQYILGFNEIASEAAYYTPDKVEQITGVDKDLIYEAARVFAKSSPSSLTAGIAVELQSNGFQSARAIAALQAIAGDIDVLGGAMKAKGPCLENITLKYNGTENIIGEREYPVFTKERGSAQINILSDVILNEDPYKVASLMVVGSNPVLTWPNAGKLKKALEKLDFLVVMDNYLTETAKMADIVLPGASVLERDEIYIRNSRQENIIGISPRVTSLNGTLSEVDFIIKLAHKMGYESLFPFENEREAIKYRIRKISELEFNGDKVETVYGEYTEKKYVKEGFNTTSGKIEVYSSKLKGYGFSPIPKYEEPFESPVNSMSSKQIVISTGDRRLEYQHSRYRNVNSITSKGENTPTGRINPKTAKAFGISIGDKVKVESKRGSIVIDIDITDKVIENTILVPHGWDDANVNLLTDNENLDKYSGFPGGRGFLATISKL